MAVQISGNDITVPRDGTFTRNVTIGGTLTYEDVTNIDSVGLVTARNGIEIGARPGVAASISVDGNAIFSGITTVGSHMAVGGVTPETFGGGYVTLEVAGSTNDNGGVFKSATSGSAGSGSSGIEMLMNTDPVGGSINVVTSHPLKFATANTERLRIDSGGNIGISTESPTGKLSVGKVGAYLNRDGITVTNPHSSGLKNGVFVLNESGYNSTSTYRAAAFKAVGESGFAIGISTDQGSNGLGGTLNYSVNFDGKSVQDGSITANGSFYQEDTNTAGDDAQDKTVEFNRRGVFLMLISYSLGTTTTDINRNVYSLGLFVSRSNGATWVPIQQDLTSAQVGNLTISDASVRGKLRIQKSSGSDARACAFRIDVLSTADVQITVTDT